VYDFILCVLKINGMDETMKNTEGFKNEILTLPALKRHLELSHAQQNSIKSGEDRFTATIHLT
jgi:hypothetical protein